MRSFLSEIKTGEFLNGNRLRSYAYVAIIFYSLCLIGYFQFFDRMLPSGAPFGSDFVSFWVSAKSAFNGSPGLPYNAELLSYAERTYFPGTPFFAFFYPPIFLLYLLPLGALDYYPALTIWLSGSLVLSIFAIRRIIVDTWPTVLAVLSFPGSFINAVHGQNAFLTASLMGLALVTLRRSQILSGILIGLISYKPQFGLLFPIALIAGGYWRATISAAVTIGVLVAISAALLGVSTWMDFLQQIPFASATLREGFVSWSKMISVYGVLRSVGVPSAVSLAVHSGVAVIAGIAVAWAWRRGTARMETRAALLIVGSIIASPFALTYDYFIVLPALAFLVIRGRAEGFVPLEKSFLFLVFVFPLIAAITMLISIRVDAALLMILFGLIVRHQLTENDHSSESALRSSPVIRK